jgi:hypothetical protein
MISFSGIVERACHRVCGGGYLSVELEDFKLIGMTTPHHGQSIPNNEACNMRDIHM